MTIPKKPFFLFLPLSLFLTHLIAAQEEEDEDYPCNGPVFGVEIFASNIPMVNSFGYIKPAVFFRNEKHVIISGFQSATMNVDYNSTRKRFIGFHTSYRYFPNPLKDKLDLFLQVKTWITREITYSNFSTQSTGGTIQHGTSEIKRLSPGFTLGYGMQFRIGLRGYINSYISFGPYRTYTRHFRQYPSNPAMNIEDYATPKNPTSPF